MVDGSDQIVSMSSQGHSFIVGLKNAVIRSPLHAVETLPLIIMLGSLTCFLSLTRSNELIITRSSGRSAIRILFFPLVITLIIGILGTTIGNPLVSISIKSSEKLLEELGIKQRSFLSVSTDGIWLREADKYKQIVVQSNRTNASGSELFDLTLFEFDGEDNLKKRIFAKKGDVLLMSIMYPTLNHVAIFLGDMVLHHLADRLSCREPYSEWLLKCTGKRYRYAQKS